MYTYIYIYVCALASRRPCWIWCKLLARAWNITSDVAIEWDLLVRESHAWCTYFMVRFDNRPSALKCYRLSGDDDDAFAVQCVATVIGQIHQNKTKYPDDSIVCIQKDLNKRTRYLLNGRDKTLIYTIHVYCSGSILIHKVHYCKLW